MSSPTDTLAHHPVARACEQVTAALDALGEAVRSAWSGTDADLAGWVKATDVAVSRIAAVQAEVIAECAARDLPKRAGSTGGTAWLAGVLTARPGRAAALWRLANDLADGPRASLIATSYDGNLNAQTDADADADAAGTVWALDAEPRSATSLALAAGAIDADQAAVIARAIAALPAAVDPSTRATGEAYLLEHAAVHHAGALGHLADRLLDVVAPDLAEARLDELLSRDEARAAQTSLTASDDRHGMVSVRGRFDVESWAFVAAALDPLAAPRPTSSPGTPGTPAILDGPGITRTDHDSTGMRDNTHLGTSGSPLDLTTGRDTRPQPRRLAEALVELARRMLDSGTLPSTGGAKPHVVVTVDQHALATEVGAGQLDTGQTLSARAVRRLSCDAVITTILRDRAGQPLDVGRSQRLFPPALRRALVDRDRGCAFPGCSRPPSWCEAHHIVHWADGGPTSLDNGVLLCGHHHRLLHSDAHHDGWSVQVVT